MRDPDFWWRDGSLIGGLLSPLGLAYGAIAARRMAVKGISAGVPVICAGNFTLGGAGKTPTALWLAKQLLAGGLRPHFLSRGYGGRLSGPKIVNANDTAADVGDEALLLARVAPTVIARDRVAGALVAHAAGANVVIMDDGLQNVSLSKDFTIAVVDCRRGIGNGRVFPAGPLRAPLDLQLAHSDALLMIGDGARGTIDTNLPVFHGRLVPQPDTVTALKSKNVLAFAGIGDPEKFFSTVSTAGITIAQRRSFADHHRYTAADAAVLMAQAEGLTLLTTEKDLARMAGDPALAELGARAQALPVTLVVDKADELGALVLAKVRR